MFFLKDLPEDNAEQVLELARKAIGENKIIGIDSSESPNWVQRFQKVVLKARLLGLKIVTHCQENTTDQSGGEVLHFLQPNRIDHGYFMHEDQKILEKIKNDNIHITMCPFWSTRGSKFPNKKDYPIKKYLDFGLSININSDYPAYHGATINEGLIYVQDMWNLTKKE
ncbi:amidohydrolase family protein [Spiroplasma taiwanense]|uniref:hypothetical protein n=1 Tax=Spiroplasma taiwanense TaxID=2145 RepID=UPI0004080A73|nr:hypothetical protein [Spiroplasma taiwanense]